MSPYMLACLGILSFKSVAVVSLYSILGKLLLWLPIHFGAGWGFCVGILGGFEEHFPI